MLAFAALCKAALALSGDAFGIEQEMKYYFHVQSSPREPRRFYEMPRFVLRGWYVGCAGEAVPGAGGSKTL